MNMLSIFIMLSFFSSLTFIIKMENKSKIIDAYKKLFINKNCFGKIYVGIYCILTLPGVLISVSFDFILKIILWIGKLGVKK